MLDPIDIITRTQRTRFDKGLFLSNRLFKANNWLNSNEFSASVADGDSIPSGYDELPPLPATQNPELPPIGDLNTEISKFALSQFIIPEWKGESLLSKEAVKVKRLLEKLFDDALSQIEDFNNKNNSIKKSVYSEFLSYAHERDINDLHIDNFTDFWLEYSNDHSADARHIANFKKILAFRAITVYLFKIRFFVVLGTDISMAFSENDFLTPDYCLRKIFKKGSSTEIESDALQQNQYSWYRPSGSLKELIYKTVSDINSLSLAEILKLCRPHTFNIEHIAEKESYSHSLSTRTFGLFLNQLMVEFPAWLEMRKVSTSINGKGPKAINTFYSGQYLQSLSSAHWLAQEFNSNIKWSEILCPDFMGENFADGHYLKICHELHFLSFLVHLAKKQNYEAVQLICSVFKQKQRKGQEATTLFSYADSSHISYDRALLNLVTLPKKNPHHYLINKINQTANKLAQNGYIYVFTNQKLFVPSQSDRVEQFLKDFKVEASFNFEDLKGRGEIANFLYIITKRNVNQGRALRAPNSLKAQKESLLSFNLTGQLSQFGKFNKFVAELFNFFKTKTPHATPIFQTETEDGLGLEFHQDAILEGKLLSATTNSNAQFTHPNYFKNLMKSCVPLDQFFIIENLHGETTNVKSVTSELLGITFKQEERFPILLIVDYTNEAAIKIELTSSDLYKAKLEQNGQAYFQYFGLIPKINDININLFRDFFNTPVGNQVVQICLNGGATKVKSKLRSLLIPKFFGQNEFIPKHIEPAVRFLYTQKEELLAQHPNHIGANFNDVTKVLSHLGKNYPWHTLSLLSNFKYNLEECLSEFKHTDVNFMNPLVKEPLCKLETYPVYPNNRDIYLSIETTDLADIHAPLGEMVSKYDENGHFIELYSAAGACIVKIHAEAAMINFIKFVLTNATGMKISNIIQALKVPKTDELKLVLENYKMLSESISKLHEETLKHIVALLGQQISAN